MKLYLAGHSYRYAVEQMLMQILDGERPVFVDQQPDDAENHAVVGLKRGTVSLICETVSVSAFTRICHGGKVFTGEAVNSRAPVADSMAYDRECQRLIKLSFFRAARKVTGRELPWGATSGIRPSTLLTRMIRDGVDINTAEKRLIKNYYISPERASLARSCAEAEVAARVTLAPQDIALYIGIPFCPTRCAYCSFVSNSVEKSFKLLAPFINALKDESAALAEVTRDLNLRIVSVYIGGGTPTTLTSEMLEDLLSHLERVFDFSALREYSVEAGRPDTITREKLAVLRLHGVTRVSVNPQTMSDEVLELIGRRHSAAETLAAYKLTREAGFECVNMDLIAGLPGDTPQGFAETLRQVLELEPENLTVHTLSIKRGTRVMLENTPIPDGAAVSEMLSHTLRELRDAGYKPYYLYRQKFPSGGFENTGWTKPGYDSLYNIIMMDELQPVLALGSGVTKLVVPEGFDQAGRIERIFNPKYPYEYIERRAEISDKKRHREFFERLLNNAI